MLVILKAFPLVGTRMSTWSIDLSGFPSPSYASCPADWRQYWFQMSSLSSGRQNRRDDWARRSRSAPDWQKRRWLPDCEEWFLLSQRPEKDSGPPVDLEQTGSLHRIRSQLNNAAFCTKDSKKIWNVKDQRRKLTVQNLLIKKSLLEAKKSRLWSWPNYYFYNYLLWPLL